MSNVLISKLQSSKIKQKNDAPLPYQLTFQDPATSSMEGIIDVHHEIMFYVVMIITFVLWMLVRIVVLFGTDKPLLPYSNITHNDKLE